MTRRDQTLMNVLAITNLYPNNIQPDRGVFNRQQFEWLNR